MVLHATPFITPVQPVLRYTPPTGEGWVHECKFDGYRGQLHVADGHVTIFSKNGREFTNRFPAIAEAAAGLRAKSALIDGEVVVSRPDGVPDFRALHSGNYAQSNLIMWCFDLMHLNGEDIRRLPLIVRKMKLGSLLRRLGHPQLQYSEPFPDPVKLLKQCGVMGLEGIVSKRRDAPYGARKGDWLKIKCAQWREANKDRGDLFGQGR